MMIPAQTVPLGGLIQHCYWPLFSPFYSYCVILQPNLQEKSDYRLRGGQLNTVKHSLIQSLLTIYQCHVYCDFLTCWISLDWISLKSRFYWVREANILELEDKKHEHDNYFTDFIQWNSLQFRLMYRVETLLQDNITVEMLHFILICKILIKWRNSCWNKQFSSDLTCSYAWPLQLCWQNSVALT